MPTFFRSRSVALLAAGVAVAAAAVAIPVGAAGAAPACSWTATKLPPLPGSANHGGAVLGTDGAGTYSGYAFQAKAQHAALWRAGAIVDLGQPFGTPTVAQDVNRAGTAVGWSIAAGNISTAILWRNGVAAALPLPAGSGPSARALSINDNNQVAGWRTDAAGHELGVIWSVAGATPTILREYAGTDLDAVDASNRVVGLRRDAGGTLTAIKSRSSQTTVDALRPAVAGESAVATATAGTYIAGSETVAGGLGNRPVRWNATSPQVLNGGKASLSAVTAAGTAAGTLQDANGNPAHAAVWPTVDPVQLPDVGTTSTASSISDDGSQVGGSWLAVGVGVNPERPIVWTCG
jgi:uncharacterized membrane protein